MKAFVENAASPRVYFVGRSKSAADRIIDECLALNKDSKVEFLKADVSELKEVDRVCEEILKREGRLNLLVQTQGNLILRGHDCKNHPRTLHWDKSPNATKVSPEGIDRKFSLNYYSRMRFIINLLPLLNSATTSTPHFSRTLSVLGAGHEGALNLADLGLVSTFTGARCANHSIVMNDFMAEELAVRNPGMSFLHSSPGVVRTNIARELPLWARMGSSVLLRLLGRTQEETGARQLFLATSGMFPPLLSSVETRTAAGIEMPESMDVAEGSAGKVGSGAYLVDWNAEIVTKGKFLDNYRKQGVSKTVYEHTMGVLDSVARS